MLLPITLAIIISTLYIVCLGHSLVLLEVYKLELEDDEEYSATFGDIYITTPLKVFASTLLLSLKLALDSGYRGEIATEIFLTEEPKDES